jgi:inosine-uridine nucleoside N-ribohydrolase
MTVTDFELRRGGGNALVAMDIDVEKFWEVTLATYTRVAASLGGG